MVLDCVLQFAVEDVAFLGGIHFSISLIPVAMVDASELVQQEVFAGVLGVVMMDDLGFLGLHVVQYFLEEQMDVAPLLVDSVSVPQVRR